MADKPSARDLIDLIWVAKDYDEAERHVAKHDATIRADQARRDADIVHEELDCHEPTLADHTAAEIERRAGVMEDEDG